MREDLPNLTAAEVPLVPRRMSLNSRYYMARGDLNEPTELVRLLSGCARSGFFVGPGGIWISVTVCLD